MFLPLTASSSRPRGGVKNLFDAEFFLDFDFDFGFGFKGAAERTFFFFFNCY